MAVAGPQLQTPPVTATPQEKVVPFRQATIERSDILTPDSGSVSTSTQRIERTVEGSGFAFAILLKMAVVTSGNSAAVAYYEDAPWSALDTVVFRDVNGELVNLAGYDLYIANLINHYYGLFWPDGTTLGSGTAPVAPNTNLYLLTSGSGATGGSFTFWLRVPIATNRRDLTGLVGNQDRAQKYSLRNDIASGGAASSGPIYTTAPTAQGTYSVTKFYESYSVPLPMSPMGQRQESLPPSFGTLHFTTATLSDAAPLGGSVVNHYLRRLGNTVRWMALVLRSNNTRANADTNQPSSIQMKIGDDILFNENYDYRRARMYENFGFEFPKGVLVYDTLHDFDRGAGWEIGYDYWHTQAIVNAQFMITYPAGFGSTANSLKIITDDLQLGAFSRR